MNPAIAVFSYRSFADREGLLYLNAEHVLVARNVREGAGSDRGKPSVQGKLILKQLLMTARR